MLLPSARDRWSLPEKIRLRDSPRGHNDFRIFRREADAGEPHRAIDSYRVLGGHNKNKILSSAFKGS